MKTSTFQFISHRTVKFRPRASCYEFMTLESSLWAPDAYTEVVRRLAEIKTPLNI
jgi:hypothetical protein